MVGAVGVNWGRSVLTNYFPELWPFVLGGLFVVNAAFATTGLPQRAITDLMARGFDLMHPMTLLVVSGVISDIVGNNPAVMLLVPYVTGADPLLAGAAMALGTGLASNVVVFGSLAGIIAHGLGGTECQHNHGASPGVRDVIIEANVIGASRIGLSIDRGAVSTLERNNVIERRLGR